MTHWENIESLYRGFGGFLGVTTDGTVLYSDCDFNNANFEPQMTDIRTK